MPKPLLLRFQWQSGFLNCIGDWQTSLASIKALTIDMVSFSTVLSDMYMQQQGMNLYNKVKHYNFTWLLCIGSVYSSHLSSKVKYFWPMGDCYRQVPLPWSTHAVGFIGQLTLVTSRFCEPNLIKKCTSTIKVSFTTLSIPLPSFSTFYVWKGWPCGHWSVVWSSVLTGNLLLVH